MRPSFVKAHACSSNKHVVTLNRLILLVGLVTGAALLTRVTTLQSFDGPGPSEYVGQQTCVTAACHFAGYSGTSDYKGLVLFKQTVHQQIHLRPTPETVILDRMFERDTMISTPVVQIRYPGRDTLRIRLFKQGIGRDYAIQLSFSGGGDSTPPMRVAYTYGGRAWIERFLVDIDGRYYIPPFQFALPGYKQRSEHGGAFYFLDFKRWFDIDTLTGEGRFYEFTSPTFRKQSWHEACAPCHVNGATLTVDRADTADVFTVQYPGSYGTDSMARDANIVIGCESCHGPGSQHVAQPTSDNIVSPGKSAQFPGTYMGTELKLDLCGQCHERYVSTMGKHPFAYDDATPQHYVPGVSLGQFRRDSVTGRQTWADNTTSYAHHQTGQDYRTSVPHSRQVFSNGCWSCHTIHFNKYDSSFGGELPYQLNRNWYSLDSNAGCVAGACHPDMRDTGPSLARGGRIVNLHSQHDQAVSQCVNCHFTKTASIGFVDLPGKRLYEFSSHGFKVLPPSLTLDYAGDFRGGMLNTCSESCHRNGRGSRNSAASTPEAPAFGTQDRYYGLWNERSDLDLADSLAAGYGRLFGRYTIGVLEQDISLGPTRIESCVPNPLTEGTEVRYVAGESGLVDLTVVDIRGQIVRRLVCGEHRRGTYSTRWDGNDGLGRSAGAGRYFIVLSVGGRYVESSAVEVMR